MNTVFKECPTRLFNMCNERHLAYVEVDSESLHRGGSCRTAVCLCGWKGPQRGTLELVTDDALMHERTANKSMSARRDELVKRIASNKEWLSKNWNLGKDVRRGCQANIEADECELTKLERFQTFDPYCLEDMKSPFTVEVFWSRYPNEKRVPIGLPQCSDLRKDQIRRLEKWLTNDWAGGGWYTIEVRDTTGTCMIWNTNFDLSLWPSQKFTSLFGFAYPINPTELKIR